MLSAMVSARIKSEIADHSAEERPPVRRLAHTRKRLPPAEPEAREPFCRMAPGELIVYHRGHLTHDRVENPELDAVACEALRLSAGVRENRIGSRAQITTGTVMLELSQIRQPDGTCHYLARRIR